jgi:anti-sigma-K factor RskA
MNDPVRGPQRSPTRAERDERALHAYYDGELRGVARWRFERRLARSPELQREMRQVAELGALLRERASEAPGPELWDRIALRLPAADARRAAAAQASGARRWLAWWPSLGAAAATLAVAALVAQRWLAPAAVEQAGVVRWMDSRGRSVMVLEEDQQSDVTIIWLLDGGPGVGAAGGERGAS